MKNKKAEMGNEFMSWIIGIIIFLVVLGALYFLLKHLGIF